MTDTIPIAPTLPDPQTLPDDAGALKSHIRQLYSMIGLFSLGYADLHYRYRDLLRRVHGNKSEKLKTVLKNMDRGQKDPTQSEPVQPDTPAAGETGKTAETDKKPRKHGGGGRRKPPKGLPVVRQVIDLPEDQKVGMRWIRNEITYQTEYRPSQFYVLEIVRPVYASIDRKGPPKVMPLPPQVIPQAGVGVGFIVHVILSKYRWHIPYYRQEFLDADGGVNISRQARYRYAQAGGELLWHVREELKQQLLAEGYLLIDETFVPMIDPDREGRTHMAYMWGYLGPKSKACVLEFSVSKSTDNLEDFFYPERNGVRIPLVKGLQIHSDGARMYVRFTKNHPDVQHHLCWQHLRRKLIAALKANEAEALPLLQEIGKLYGIEDQAEEWARARKQDLTDTQRGYFRHAYAKPILKRLQKRFLELRARPGLFGNLRKAVIYGTKRWRELARYAKVGNGKVFLDTNRLEQQFRPGKIGAKNWMFIGHPNAGWLPAVFYSITSTCRLIGVNVRDYLMWVLPQLAAQDRETRSAKGLLPHDYAKLLKAGKIESPAAPWRFVRVTRPLSCKIAHRLIARRCRRRRTRARLKAVRRHPVTRKAA